MRRAAVLIAVAACAGLLVLAGAGAAKEHHKTGKKRHRVGAVVTLNETPVQSGSVVAARGCQRKRYVEVHRASNDALVAVATSDDSGAFRAPGGYSGQAYAVAKSSKHKKGHKKIKCLSARSPVVSLGVADLRVTQVAVPGATTNGNPAYDLTVSNLGPDTAQDILLTETANPVPANGAFTLNATYTSAGCSLSAGNVKCTVGTLTPGFSATRRIAYSCGALTDHFSGSAAASSSARDPNVANSTTPNLTSVMCN